MKRIPAWAVALVGFPAGLAFAGALGVVGKDVIAYVAMAALAEALASFKVWMDRKRREDDGPAPMQSTTGVYQVIETSGTIARRDPP